VKNAASRPVDRPACDVASRGGIGPTGWWTTPLPWLVGIVILAFVQVGGTFGAARREPSAHPVDALAIVLALLGPASLLLLRRRPRVLVWTVAAVTLVYLARGYPYGPVFISLALSGVYAVATGYRVAAWAAFAMLFAGHLVALVARHEEWSWSWLVGALAWALLLLAVGELVRVRRERVLAARRARIEAQERQAGEERLRVARELHDVVAHHMSLINVQAGVALHLMDRRPEQAQTALEAIKDASKEALVELRSLVGILRAEGEAAPRSPTGGLASLDDLVARSAQAGLAVRLTREGDVGPLPAAVELAALRIVQEAITNVVRHAGAAHAEISLVYRRDVLEVTVTDDGRGLGQAQREGPGRGLVGMRERAEGLGGTVTVAAADDGGARVHAVLPVDRSAE
jgi:signal transduction histidine kinase